MQLRNPTQIPHGIRRLFGRTLYPLFPPLFPPLFLPYFLLLTQPNIQVFASHAIGGIVGNLLTAIFAQKSIAALDGFTDIPGGWLDGNFIQLAWHIADSAAGFGYSFGMTVRLSLPLAFREPAVLI